MHARLADSDAMSQKPFWTLALAIISIYAVDFAINAGNPPPTKSCYLVAKILILDVVQSSCRSLIVDTLPASKQQLGSAWGKSTSCPATLREIFAFIEILKQVEWLPLGI